MLKFYFIERVGVALHNCRAPAVITSAAYDTRGPAEQVCKVLNRDSFDGTFFYRPVALAFDIEPYGLGEELLRPAGQLGTHGFRPYPWQAVAFDEHTDIRDAATEVFYHV